MSQTVRGMITRFVYKHPVTGWKIGKFKPADGTAEFTIKGEIAESNLDFDLDIKGEWVENASYGREFQVTNVLRSTPTTGDSLRTWLVNNVKGVGPGAAKKLVEQFGPAELRKILDTEPMRLAEVKGISKATALAAKLAWTEDTTLREVGLLLSQSNLSDRLARKVVNAFGPNSVQIIQDNPYRLTRVSGIGFKTADKMALGMGWSVQRPERIEAALSFLLIEGVQDGHSFLHKSELITKVRSLAEIDNEGKAELLPEVMALTAVERAIEKGDIRLEVITTNEVKHYLCYLPKYHDYESEAAARIAELLSTPHVAPQNIDGVLAGVESTLQLTLSDKQKEAVINALSTNCSIITGLPGTGKTSTVRALVNTARQMGLNVRLAAPTGRAAKRLSEVTNSQALTIHRLLKFDPESGGFVFNAKNKLQDCNMLILDEASMLDLELMVSVMRAVPDDCSVVWIGDINQLPSVGAGTVLRDLINSKRIRTTVLDKIFRQAEGSLIIQNAHRIHRGEMPAFPPKGGEGDSYWIQVPKALNEKTDRTTDDIEFVKSKLVNIYARLEAKGYDPIRDIQVLTPMRVGQAGYLAFNQVIQSVLNPDGKKIEIGGQTFRVGDRIMQTKNDYELDVYNGDVGFISDIMIEDKMIAIEWSDRESMYPFESTENLSLSYAVSTHKAQGSEFKVVILILLNQHNVMLDRNLIYTANTRARELCIYLASHSAVEMAVKTQHVLKRNSILSMRIRAAVDSGERKVERI